MGDIDGPDIAKRVYEYLFGPESEYLHPDTIPYALDYAVRSLRHRGVRASRWVPYVHMGV